jgi:hypothetical protein
MTGVDDPGAFTAFDDGTAIVCGDGNITPTQATTYYLDYLVARDSTLAPFDKDPAAAAYGAQLFVKNNAKLGLTSIDTPIPLGGRFSMESMSLKQLLAPFVGKLDTLRALVAQGGGLGGNRVTNQVLGKTRAPALGIPIE